MILDKTTKIKIVNKNKKYYLNKGYNINNSTIDIKIEDLPLFCKNILQVQCDYCGKEQKLAYYAYMKNYNKGNVYNCNECKNIKIEQTNLKKYGVKRPIQNKEIQQKLQQTNFEKYGFNTASKNEDIKKKTKQTTTNKLKQKYQQYNILNIENGICDIFCEKCKTIYQINFSLLNLRIKYNVETCIYCNPINTFNSNSEHQLLEFILEYYSGPIIIKNRTIIKPYELDIYLPELKLAFEYNGVYWHSEYEKEINYHQMKSDLCDEKGIQLIHVWEDDWKYKQEIIKSIILNKLNIYEQIINSKDCEIKKINNKNQFLFKNHLDGSIESISNYGLFYNNELVSLICLKDNKIIRYCDKLFYKVLNSLETLLQFINYQEYFLEVNRDYCGFNFLSEKFNPILIPRIYENQTFNTYNSGILKYKIII